MCAAEFLLLLWSHSVSVNTQVLSHQPEIKAAIIATLLRLHSFHLLVYYKVFVFCKSSKLLSVGNN